MRHKSRNEYHKNNITKRAYNKPTLWDRNQTLVAYLTILLMGVSHSAGRLPTIEWKKLSQNYFLNVNQAIILERSSYEMLRKQVDSQSPSRHSPGWYSVRRRIGAKDACTKGYVHTCHPLVNCCSFHSIIPVNLDKHLSDFASTVAEFNEKLLHSRDGTPKHTQTIIYATQKETVVDQQQHSCETLIYQRDQIILRFLSTAVTASTRWRVRELYCQTS
jgi:hypothetical protein